MQWDNSQNLGFSTAPAEQLYLPTDPAQDAPTVEAQENDPNSFLNHVRSIIELRHNHEDLQAYSPFAVYSAEKGSRLFAYKRGAYLLAVNPGLQTETLSLDGKYKSIFTIGAPTVNGSAAILPPQSFLIMKPSE